MLSQPDFISEETLLQFHGKKLGVTVDCTPKCHPELAGEGIEYAWGCAKNAYRCLPICQKHQKDRFQQSVQSCISQDTLTVMLIRKFSRRARQYIMAYSELENENSKQQSTKVSTDVSKVSTSTSSLALTMPRIEKLVKRFKTHCSAVDFDKSFIDSSVRSGTTSSAVSNGGVNQEIKTLKVTQSLLQKQRVKFFSNELLRNILAVALSPDRQSNKTYSQIAS